MFLHDEIVITRPRIRKQASPDALWTDWRMLCEKIGERRAGSVGEKRAAAFIAQRLAAAGVPDVRLETFPCIGLRDATVEVHEPHGRGWRRVDAAAVVGAPGIRGGRAVTGELVWLELPEGGHRIDARRVRGRIVAIFGPLPATAVVHARLVAARPLAVIHVDDRLPFSWTKRDGVYPYWTRRYGMPPTLTVPYTAAWRWRRDDVRRLKIRVAIEQSAAESQNVVAELPGTVPHLPALAITAHHDTQCDNVGADDNASGVVLLLALARRLARTPLRRTVRFISFGTEEQLSVGSVAYVRRHRITAADVGLVLNFDSIASPLGHWTLSVAGDDALARFGGRQLSARGLAVDVRREITPFSDHFPFNRAGVPSLLFMRTNFPGGRWQHHSRHDNLQNVSRAAVQRLLTAVHPLAATLAARARWPFRATLPRPQQALARRIGRELFG